MIKVTSSIKCLTFSIVCGQKILNHLLLGNSLHGDHKIILLLLGDMASQMLLLVVTPASLANLTPTNNRVHLLHHRVYLSVATNHRADLRHATQRIHLRHARHRIHIRYSSHLAHLRYTSHSNASIHTLNHAVTNRSRFACLFSYTIPSVYVLHSSLQSRNLRGALLLLLVQCFINHLFDSFIESSSLFRKSLFSFSFFSLFCFF